METEGKIKVGIGIAVIALLIASPFGIMAINSFKYASHKVDDLTNYETKKKVENTCRNYIVSYEGDKLMYEMYKDYTSAEERKWAQNAKLRANKTAIAYNEYILKNNYVFDGNIPEDIKDKLEIIE